MYQDGTRCDLSPHFVPASCRSEVWWLIFKVSTSEKYFHCKWILYLQLAAWNPTKWVLCDQSQRQNTQTPSCRSVCTHYAIQSGRQVASCVPLFNFFKTHLLNERARTTTESIFSVFDISFLHNRIINVNVNNLLICFKIFHTLIPLALGV